MARHHPRPPRQEAAPAHHRARGDARRRVHGRDARAHRHDGQGLRRPVRRRQPRHRRVRARSDRVQERLRRRAQPPPRLARHDRRGRPGRRRGRRLGAGLRAAGEGGREGAERRTGSQHREQLGRGARAEPVDDRGRTSAAGDAGDHHRQGQRQRWRLHRRPTGEGVAEGPDAGDDDRRHREVRLHGLAGRRHVRRVRVQHGSEAVGRPRSDRLDLRGRGSRRVTRAARREHREGRPRGRRGAHR